MKVMIVFVRAYQIITGYYMEIKKVKLKQLCPHKLARLSSQRPSLSPKPCHPKHHSSNKSSKKALIKELQSQN